MNYSLPPIRTDGALVTYDPSKNSKVFSTVFQNKLSDQELNLPLTFFPKSKFITPTPKGSSPSKFRSVYRPILITPIISKVYEKLIS